MFGMRHVMRLREANTLFVYGFSLPATDCLIGLWLKRKSHTAVCFNQSRYDADPIPVSIDSGD